MAVSANDVPEAFTYVNANTSNEYTLLLDANVMIGAQNLNSANAKLTIIGIGVERFITANSSNGRLFSIDGSNANLTLGKNITLMGKSATTHMIYVQRGTLNILNGSKITGHWSASTSVNVVSITGINAGFKMEGGEISENTINYYSFISVVNVSAGATFEMSGGTVAGNSAYMDVFINDDNSKFLLSGSARISTIYLYANNNTTRSTITIVGNYSGTINTLHLSGNNTNLTNVAAFWTNAPVIVNGTAGIISMFNNGSLGNFRVGSGSTPIRNTHELNANGILVRK